MPSNTGRIRQPRTSSRLKGAPAENLVLHEDDEEREHLGQNRHAFEQEEWQVHGAGDLVRCTGLPRNAFSGASRELTEGFGSLLAAVILLSVGIWMHGKSQAEEWRRYIRDKMQGALSRGSAWFLFGLAFIVVYREVFETILFYAALWTPDNGATIVAGALSAVAMLAIISWAMLRYSRTLPITEFFRYSAILIAILTVVLAGKGVGALQEAGIIAITPLGWVPRIAMLGLFPTMESVATQIVMLVAVIWGFRSATKRHPHPLPAE